MLLTFLRNFRKMELDKILLDVSDGLDMRKINGDLYAVLKFKFVFIIRGIFSKIPFEKGERSTFFFAQKKKGCKKEVCEQAARPLTDTTT